MLVLNIKNGASPSGKATGFGPVIAKVRILPSQLSFMKRKIGLHYIHIYII